MKSQTTQECISLISLSHGITCTVMTGLQAWCLTCCPGRASLPLTFFTKGNGDKASGIHATNPQWRAVGFRLRSEWKSDGKAALKIFFPTSELDTKLLQCRPLFWETKACSAVYVKGRSLVFLLVRWEEKQWTQRKSQTLFFTNKAAVVTFLGKSTLTCCTSHTATSILRAAKVPLFSWATELKVSYGFLQVTSL